MYNSIKKFIWLHIFKLISFIHEYALWSR